MKTEFGELYQRLLDAFEEPVDLPACGLKFVNHDEEDINGEFSKSPRWIESFGKSLASCGYSYKAAKGGHTVMVTKENIGCPAGAMSLGLVSNTSEQEFFGGCYVEAMKTPAKPVDFSSGFVYALSLIHI